jgi:hypothetical protein
MEKAKAGEKKAAHGRKTAYALIQGICSKLPKRAAGALDFDILGLLFLMA